MKKFPTNHPEGYLKDVFNVLKQYTFPFIQPDVHSDADPAFLFRIIQSIPDLILVIDLHTNGYVYINTPEILGYESHEFIQGGLQRAFRMIPASHRHIITQQIFPVMFRYFEECCLAGNFKGLQACYPTQLIHRDRSTHWFKHTISILSTDAQNRPLLLLKTLTDIDDIKKDAYMDFTITRLNESKKTEVLFKERYLPQVANTILSERESQVLSLISLGYTSQQIAEKLFISLHTVSTHRKNILRKTFCKGTAELAAYAWNGVPPEH